MQKTPETCSPQTVLLPDCSDVFTPMHCRVLTVLSQALGGSIQHTAELYEQYAALLDEEHSGTHSPKLEALSFAHHQQLHLAARVLHYSLYPPQPQPSPVELEAYLWEWAVALPDLVEAGPEPDNRARRMTGWVDLALLQPLMEEYARNTAQITSGRITYAIRREAENHFGLHFAPQMAKKMPAKPRWNSATAILACDASVESYSDRYGLSLSYATIIRDACPVWFAAESSGRLMMKIGITPLE